MSDVPVMAIGESFVGTGAEAAHLNTVLGPRDGPVGTAWATALATPRQGHTPFVAVLRPGLPAKPMTLFVNKAAIASPEHGILTWGPHRRAWHQGWPTPSPRASSRRPRATNSC